MTWCQLRLHNVAAQMLADGIARKPGSAGDLTDGQGLTQCPALDVTLKVATSITPSLLLHNKAAG